MKEDIRKKIAQNRGAGGEIKHEIVGLPGTMLNNNND